MSQMFLGRFDFEASGSAYPSKGGMADDGASFCHMNFLQSRPHLPEVDERVMRRITRATSKLAFTSSAPK